MTDIDPITQPQDASALAVSAVRRYYAAGRKLDDQTLVELQIELDEASLDCNRLYWWLTGLVSVSVRLTEAGDRTASEILTRFIKAQKARFPVLEAAVLGLSQDESEAKMKAACMRTTIKAAPMFGAEAADKQLSLKDLAPRRRIR